jgi:hypothetical protein
MAVSPAESRPASNPFAAVEAWDWREPVVFEPAADAYERDRERMNDVDRETFRAFAAYADDDGVCFPSQATIAADLNVCPKTVQRRARRLIEGGHMRVAERRWSPFSRHRHNVYELLSLDLCPVSDLAQKRITRRAHERDPGRVERARRVIRRGLIGLGCPTKRTDGARARRGPCGCRSCSGARGHRSADSERLRARWLARVRWRPTDPRWREELEARLRRDGRDPLMAWMLESSLDDLPDGQPWPPAGPRPLPM